MSLTQAEYVENKSLPLIPLLPQLSLHCLAVDGAQPLIFENPAKQSQRRKNAEELLLPHTFSTEIQVNLLR